MNFLTAKTRITIGLVCLSLSILLVAIFAGMIPDRRAAVLDGRRMMCEAIAVNASILVSRRDLKRLEAILQTVVRRNREVLSAGIRRSDGKLEVEVGAHVQQWRGVADDRSVETELKVPLYAGTEKWGVVEMRFIPLRQPGLAGMLNDPMTRLVAFFGSAGYLLYLMYLRKMLQHLDPSKAVPKRVRTALDTLAEGLLVTDHRERIVLANQAFAKWLGFDPLKLIGRNISEFSWAASDETPLQSYPWTQAIQQGEETTGVVMQLVNRDHQKRNLMVNAMPIPGPNGKSRGVLVSLDDVTVLEETKKELSRSKLEAEEANQAKSEFLARMSHEIRTPMNAILGYTDVLRRGFDESVEDRQEYLNTIHGSGEHLLALINDILDLSKIESGRMELELDRHSPYQLVTQVITLLQAKADEKEIALSFECDGPLPETILADSVRLRQTIVNLAGNAIKFTDQGGVRIVTRLQAGDPGQREPKLEIDVIDTGIGISAEAQARIFDPFSQADNSITRRFGGTGLGLAISRQLAEAMGGGVCVSSRPGEGSTFSVAIDTGPLEGIRLLSAEQAKAAVRLKSEQTGQQVRLPAGRVLVVDDGDSNRKLMQLVLTRAGAKVDQAENGQQAVDLALKQPYDVILMDMQMPVMDGYTAATTLRQAGYERPIIALTAHAMQGDEEKCRLAGCSGFLTKPINIDRLLATLSQVLTEVKGQELSSNEDQDIHSIESQVAEISDMTQQVVAASRNTKSSPADEPLLSSLPTDDADFREIVDEFRTRLAEKLKAMELAAEQQDMEELAGLAHWLKGSGGTAGLDVFTHPARELERFARSGQTDRLAGCIHELRLLADRIVIADEPEPVASGLAPDVPTPQRQGNLEPLHSSLPTEDPEFHEIVVEFAHRLAGKLSEMERACRDRNFDELAGLAHWLKGSGGTAGFEAFTEPGRELERVAKSEMETEARQAVAHLRALADRIEIGAHHGSTTSVNLSARPQPPALTPGIRSTLPTDDPEFCEIVIEFTERFHQKLDALDRAYDKQDLDELASLAHWLKGSAGTAGFEALTPQARHLELHCKEARFKEIRRAIDQLRQLAQQIEIPGKFSDTQDGPRDRRPESPQSVRETIGPEAELQLRSSLPTEDPEFAQIVLEFEDRLQKKIGQMQLACQDSDFQQLANLAHWLKGSGGTAGFDEFTAPARQLERFAKEGDAQQVQSQLEHLLSLTRRIVLPDTPSAVT